MTSSNRQIITVFGATGAQGGSVVRSLLKNKTHSFHVRAVTRNRSSNSARELINLGAEVVQADGWKKDEVSSAFAGSWAAFMNTNSDDPVFHGGGPTEVDLGKNIIDGIIASQSVEHLVYSSLVSAKEVTRGKVSVSAMESKSTIEKYARNTGHFKTVSSIHAGWYFELLADELMKKALYGFPDVTDSDGYVSLSAPRWGGSRDAEVPWVSMQNDYGDIVHGILLDPERYNGEIVPGLSDAVTFPQLVTAFEKVTGKKSRYICLGSYEAFAPDDRGLEDLRYVFAVGQVTDGKYFGDVAVSTTIPLRLKKEAVKAQGGDFNDARLTTAEDWFRTQFQTG